MRSNSLTQLEQLSDAQRLELLVDTLSDYAICMLDAEGRVASWNKGAQRLEGYPSGEIVGHHFSRFFTVEDQAKGLPGQLLLEAKSAGRCENEGWRVRKDGSRFWALATLNTIRAENGRLIGFARVTRDITERRAAQEALRESEDRFRLLVDGLVDHAIYMLDPSGVITNWNAGAERMKGYAADEILGQHFSRFYTKEDRAAGLPIRVLEAAAREGRYDAEGWRVRKDGSRFWASVVIDAIRDESGELLGFAKITRDITERRAAQEALRESEHRFRVLVEGITDYALIMLDPNGIVSNWNSGAVRIKGYTAEEIVGHHFSRFYTDHERAAGMPARALQIAAQEGRYESEGWRVRKDGTLFWANAIIDAIKDRAGNLIGFAKITRDITERRQAQLALQEAQAQRDHAQKMEVLAQLTAGVAHDFNNLLMIVLGNLHRLKRLVAEDARGTRAAEAIETAVKRGESLTHQLLSFSRRQTLNPVVTGVGERIDAIRIMLASSIGESAKLVTHVQPGTWPIKVDVNEFELALVNLALNARDAMPQGGVITITGDNAQLAAKDTPARLEGEFVALTIADTGVGIAPDILPKVFDPFFTTKQGSKGSGLGLSQVYGFAHQSGGTVSVASELGQGTRVTLYLPRALAEPERQGAPAPEPAAAASGTVLLVEDNPDVAEASVSVLEELGYRVEVADSADAAFKAVEGQAFDLVVSDIVMAGATDGIGFARALRQRSPLLPVLLVTGYSNESIGADLEFTVLRKPYQATELSRAIAKAISETRPASSNLVRLSDVRQGGPRKPDRSS